MKKAYFCAEKSEEEPESQRTGKPMYRKSKRRYYIFFFAIRTSLQSFIADICFGCVEY